mmetsp:Transcript_52037/g.113693  ORF Transcript_52037/g.113693 Transcript_52037/m.113693 type:complete len:459 (+) Transcript_52037:241-1617(+)
MFCKSLYARREPDGRPVSDTRLSCLASGLVALNMIRASVRGAPERAEPRRGSGPKDFHWENWLCRSRPSLRGLLAPRRRLTVLHRVGLRLPVAGRRVLDLRAGHLAHRRDGVHGRRSRGHRDRLLLARGLPLHPGLRVEERVHAAGRQVLRAGHLEEEVHDAAGDLVEGADDHELLGVHLLHDARVAGQRHHLLLDVADDGLAVVRARVLDALQAVEVQATLERHQAVAELLGLSAQGVLGQARGLDGAAALVAHDHEHLHLQVVHGVLQRAHGGVGHGVAGAADHEHVAQVLVEDDLRRHAGVGAAQDRGVRELLADQRAALEGAPLGPGRVAHPEAGVAALERLQHLHGRVLEACVLSSVRELAGLLHGEAHGEGPLLARLHGGARPDPRLHRGRGRRHSRHLHLHLHQHLGLRPAVLSKLLHRATHAHERAAGRGTSCGSNGGDHESHCEEVPSE